MKKFNSFYFERFEFNKDKLEANFVYSFDEDVFFEEKISFNSEKFSIRKDLDEEIINNFLFSIHIALGISYYKAFPTSNLIIKSGKLSNGQIKFWKKFYKNGLGEFLFTNKINPENLFNFVNNSDINYKKIDFNISDKALISIGGGKDSLVSIDLFEKANLDFDLFVFGKSDPIKENCAKIINKDILLTKRKISDNLLELNKQGYYNGHVPITGIIAFNQLFLAYLYDYKYLVLSNEKSANSGNTTWKGLDINHQYSKSLEFEVDFKNYIEENITHNIKYFSLLRGFYEQKIAKYFSENCKKYFNVFSSCNNNFNIDENKRLKGKIWCNNCPKCAFVFTILRPYLDDKEISLIFGEDLFFKEELKDAFLELVGISGIKPFECVGEEEEVIYSMNKSLEKYSENNFPNILKIFVEKIKNQQKNDFLKDLEKKLDELYDEDIIPTEIKNTVLNKIK